MSQELMNKAVAAQLKTTPLQFSIGDTVDVSVRIVEGDKERIQVFSGVIISRRGGGIGESFTVRRIVNNEGVERTFPVHNPKIAGIQVIRGGRVRRAKLYYLRDRVGKATRLKEVKAETAESKAASAAAKTAAAEAKAATAAAAAATTKA